MPAGASPPITVNTIITWLTCIPPVYVIGSARIGVSRAPSGVLRTKLSESQKKYNVTANKKAR